MKPFALPLVVVPLLAACAASGPTAPVEPAALPAAIKVPAGNKPSVQLSAVGEIVYVCEYKGPATDNKYEWQVREPEAKLLDSSGKQVGKLAGVPALWDYWAGSSVTAGSIATAPAAGA